MKDLGTTTRWNMVHILFGECNDVDVESAQELHDNEYLLIWAIAAYGKYLLSMGTYCCVNHYVPWDDYSVDYHEVYTLFTQRFARRIDRMIAMDIASSDKNIDDLDRSTMYIFGNEERLRNLIPPYRWDTRLLRRRCIQCNTLRNMRDFPEPGTTKPSKKGTWRSTKPVCTLCRFSA